MYLHLYGLPFNGKSLGAKLPQIKIKLLKCPNSIVSVSIDLYNNKKRPNENPIPFCYFFVCLPVIFVRDVKMSFFPIVSQGFGSF